MAEYDLTPIIIEDDLQGTYELLKSYFLRENNPFNVVSDYLSEDTFTIDFIRSYSFVASTYRANVHLAGIPQEDGTTKVSLHVRSTETQESAEREIRDRIAETMRHMVAQKKNKPLVEDGDEGASKKSNKKELVILFIVVAIIVIGTLPISCSEQFSKFWII